MSEELQNIVIGTRGSALALAQAGLTESALQAAHPELELERKVIMTTGDRRVDVPLAEVARAEGHLDKGVFIKELEVALANGEIDVAVHSLKDVPSELEKGFTIAAVLPRGPIADVLITREGGGLRGLPDGATVATSSVRRQRMLRWLRPALRVVDIRGNVPTRIRKFHESSELDGVLLAEAGLLRLGLLGEGTVQSEGRTATAEVLDPERFLPAAGQGAVALEVRAGDERMRRSCEAVDHAETSLCVTAERRFLELLGADCETPVGVLSRVTGRDLILRAVVFEEGEVEPMIGKVAGARADADRLPERLLESLERGAGPGA